MTKYRPLLDSEFERLSRHVFETEQSWSAEWLPPKVAADVKIEVSRELHELRDEWLPASLNGEPVAYLELGGTPVAIVGLMLARAAGAFHAEVDSAALLRRIAQDVIVDLISRLAGLSGLRWLSPQCIPTSILHRGAASVLIVVKVGGKSIARIVLTREALTRFIVTTVKRTSSATRRLERRSDALRTSSANLTVLLARDSFSLGDLREMKVGHVLALNRRIDQALDVLMPGEQTDAKCYLGRIDKHLAIRVTKAVEGKG